MAYFYLEAGVCLIRMAGDGVLSRRLLLPLLIVTVSILAGFATSGATDQQSGHDWTQFGWDLASSSASTDPTGISAANVASLSRRQVNLNGTVDASAIYLQGVTVKGSRHDVFFVTTTYGKTIAVDAGQGTVLWEYTPPKYSSWEGTRQITNSTPVADPDRDNIYAAAPDGTIQKLAVSDGHALWTTAITLLPLREKIASPLKEFHGHIIAVTGGYIGDRPPYQGHVAILDSGSGKLLHVWNSLCSDRPGLLVPSSCPSTQSAIWGRAGAVIDAATGNIFVATGNGQYNGKTDWGDATIELNSDATRMVGNFTPTNNAQLNDRDLDIGSTSPVLLGGDFLAQGGKDRLIRLLSIHGIAGTAANQDHELQAVSTPSDAMLFTAPAVWRHDGETWMIAVIPAVRPLGRSRPASSSRCGRIAMAGPAQSSPAPCSTFTVRTAVSASTSLRAASRLPTSKAAAATGTAPSWWTARSPFPKATPINTPRPACSISGACRPGVDAAAGR
jgi:hypothetical protein